MTRTEVLQEIRRMRFNEAYGGWRDRRLTQEEAARLLGVCERTFRRYVERYEDEGLDGLADKRLGQVSARRAPVDEVVRTETLYRERYDGWNVAHFYSFYRRRHGGGRSYTWVKNTLQRAGLVAKAPARGKHRRRRERAPLAGMMLHQDGSTHQWVPGQYWDLIITVDDATSQHYSMFFVEQEGTASSFQAMTEVIKQRGLPSSLYTDRGSHYWHTPHAGGKVDRDNPTQFARAMRQLGVEMIPAYSPQARGRCERMFATHQQRLPKELAAQGITTMAEALCGRALPRGVQRGVRGARGRARQRVRALHRPGACRHRVRAPRAHRRARQLRELPGQAVADPGARAPLGVAPFWWTLGQCSEEVSRCRGDDCVTRRSTGARWLSWFARAARPGSSLLSSSALPRRSATGCVRPIATRVVVRTG